jgi:hypothetical protein
MVFVSLTKEIKQQGEAGRRKEENSPNQQTKVRGTTIHAERFNCGRVLKCERLSLLSRSDCFTPAGTLEEDEKMLEREKIK